MRDRRLPWLLSLPLMATGCWAAHAVAYRVVEQPAADPGHGYLALAPLALAIGLALGIVAAARSALAGSAPAGAPVQLFGFLPPLAFTVQEHVEGVLHGGAVLGTVLEPSFLVGLALQLPFALCALLLARVLSHVAEAAGALLSRRPRPRLRHPVVRRPSLAHRVIRTSALASRHAGRAPPQLA
jgi:hypothetical protein